MTHELVSEESLLSEVDAHPGIAEPRLVYADWLEDRGDARGEFLRNQLGLQSRIRRDADFESFQSRMRELAKSIDSVWLSRVGYYDAPLSTDEVDVEQLLSYHSLVVLRFFAPWSGPCRSMRPVIKELASQLAGWCVFLESNIDDHPELARKYKITSVPTCFVFRDGKVAETFVGAQPSSDVLAAIDSAAK